ncbi:hypothetical protein [Nannocystis pusilla]|uniref:hypothetical protein n=1 Tax=Nannocystis pusilla TaxID=889268 RepID=UPI003B7A6C62
MSARTLAGLLKERADSRAEAIALRCRVSGDEWREYTWAGYWAGARRAAAGCGPAGSAPAITC